MVLKQISQSKGRTIHGADHEKNAYTLNEIIFEQHLYLENLSVRSPKKNMTQFLESKDSKSPKIENIPIYPPTLENRKPLIYPALFIVIGVTLLMIVMVWLFFQQPSTASPVVEQYYHEPARLDQMSPKTSNPELIKPLNLGCYQFFEQYLMRSTFCLFSIN